MTEQFVLTLDAEAAARLKRLAAETGQSVEALARQMLERAAREFDGLDVAELRRLWDEADDGAPARDGREVFQRLIDKHQAQPAQTARKS